MSKRKSVVQPAESSTLQKLPRYCLHKPTGKAIVYVARKGVYLGEYGSDESLKKYNRIIERWKAGGQDAAAGNRRLKAPLDLAVVELVSKYVEWAKGRYVDSPGALQKLSIATRRLLRLYAETTIENFGPLALQTVRSSMVAEGLCRSTINAAVHQLRAIWKWGVRNELIAETHWRALLSVPALAAGEEGVRESRPVAPAGWRQVRAVLRHAPEPVRIMVKLQILTGMRPGEVVMMRPCDIEKSRFGWIYRPPQHKTRHLGRRRIIHIGPRARALLEPFLPKMPDDSAAYVFNPRYALADYNARRRDARKKYRSPSADPARRKARKRRRGVKPRKFAMHYTVGAYRTAIRRACELLWPLPAELARRGCESAEAWKARLGPAGQLAAAAWRREHLLHPHQLRHSFATRIGNRYSEEDAQVLLGHSRLQTTAIYVERDIRRGRKVIEQAG